MNYKKSILGSSFAFIIATSCCWLPSLIMAIGGGSTLLGISSGIEKLSGVFIAVGVGLLGFGIYQFYQRKNKTKSAEVVLESTRKKKPCPQMRVNTSMSAKAVKRY